MPGLSDHPFEGATPTSEPGKYEIDSSSMKGLLITVVDAEYGFFVPCLQTPGATAKLSGFCLGSNHSNAFA